MLTNESLFEAVKRDQASLEDLLKTLSGEWEYEDAVYRFYHQSYKVFRLQGRTREIVDALRRLAPGVELDARFRQIIDEGTSKRFDMQKSNANWMRETRPIVEAFMHAKYMLEMAVKYGRELDEAPHTLPSGWAALLHLYNIR